MGKRMFQLKDVKALVVDDNAVNLVVASNVLMQYGIVVEEADSGSMALRKYCENDDYDIIFMDYVMPDMNGVETIRAMRKRKSYGKTVIIALSASVSDDVVAEFEQAGADYVMSKPMKPEELSAVLKMCLPAEKFAGEENISAKERDSQKLSGRKEEKADIKAILGKVQGLDVEKGLSNVVGVAEVYVKVLYVCCSNITEQAEYIKAARELVAVGGLSIYFHSLKGIFANIGAMELAEFSKKMEFASHEQNEAYIKENAVSYIEQIEAFRDCLKNAVEECRKQNGQNTLEMHKAMEKKEYEEKIEQLLNRIRRFEYNEINELLEELILASSDEKKDILEEAYNYIQKFQYDEAFALAEKLSGKEE